MMCVMLRTERGRRAPRTTFCGAPQLCSFLSVFVWIENQGERKKRLETNSKPPGHQPSVMIHHRKSQAGMLL